MKRNRQYYLRKTHRYLGLFIGIQFLLWTLGGLYFSWTDIDEIHGDHFLKEEASNTISATHLLAKFDSTLQVESLELKFILGKAYYLVNETLLFDVTTAKPRGLITKEEAISIATSYLKDQLIPQSVEMIREVGSHHEYRGKTLPAWKLNYPSEEGLTVYISALDGSFQRVRHRQWRWFDFLWMLHTMDYEGRDNINNMVLRTFSGLGLLAVASGFFLFFTTLRIKRHQQ